MNKRGLLYLACGAVAVSAAVLGFIYRDTIGEKASELKERVSKKSKQPSQTDADTGTDTPTE